MERNNEEPQERAREYKSWMKLPRPKAPKSTFYRTAALNRQKSRPIPPNCDPLGRSKSIPNRAALPQETVNELNHIDEHDAGICESSNSLPNVLPDNTGENSSDNVCTCCNDEDLNESDNINYTDTLGGDSTGQLENNDTENQAPEVNEVDDDGNEQMENGVPEDNLKQPKMVDELNLPLHENLRCTKFEALLMILNYSFRHGLTGVAIEDLCKLVNCLLGSSCIPASIYWIKKVFGSATYNIHFYCSKCECYIGEISSDKSRSGALRCPIENCAAVCDVKSLNNGYFFVTLPLKSQLKFLLETTDNVMEKLNYRNTRDYDVDKICDIFDGSVYQTLLNNGNFLANELNLSGTVNTDGAVVFRSLKNTLYPIHFRINEFPPNIRFNQSNSLLAGVYFGRKEPNMTIFLAQFVKEMKCLYEDGFLWSPQPESFVRSKVVLIQCVLDSIAKPKAQNINQFNGYYGCGYCFHPGVVIDGSTSSQCKYIMNEDILLYDDCSVNFSVTKPVGPKKEMQQFIVDDRDDHSVRDDMQAAELKRQTSRRIMRDDINVRGMKGICPFNILLFFNMAFGFAIDYMHCVLLGVCRTLTELWFDEKSSFFIGQENVKNIEKRLLTIAPPSSISRRPRPISEMIHWKANEWRSWLLYYSLPCSVGYVGSPKLKHYCFLVSASYILIGKSISRENVQKAAWYLVQFVVGYSKLYGNYHMFYNVHLLLHLGKMVELYGPWWCYSAFSFESANGCLIKLVKGTRGVASQIAEKYSMCKLVPTVLEYYKVSKCVMEYCEDLLCYRVAKISTRHRSVTVLGSERFVALEEEEIRAFIQANIEPSPYCYERFVKNGVMYHSKYYSRRGIKSDDTVVRITPNHYGVIQRILLQNRNTEPCTVILVLKTLNISSHLSVVNNGQCKAEHIKVCSPVVYGNTVIIDAEEVSAKSILMRCGNDVYVTDFPNTFEKD